MVRFWCNRKENTENVDVDIKLNLYNLVFSMEHHLFLQADHPVNEGLGF